MKQTWRRPLALLLSVVMMISLLGTPVHAAGDGGIVVEGLCEHHTEHNDECGYSEDEICTFVCEECRTENEGNALVQTITAWEWIDEEEALVFDEESGKWTLALPGVSEENQADFDAVASMLPEKIAATIAEAEETAEITLSGWVCESCKQDGEGNWPISGTFLFTAALPDGYLLAEDAGLPEIYVQISKITLYADGCNHESGEGSTIDTDGICTVCKHFGYCGADADGDGTPEDTVTWEMAPNDNGYTLTITGTGAMTDWSGTSLFKSKVADYNRITAGVVESGVTTIGNYTFTWLENMSSIQIPDTVTSIGMNAFGSCKALKEVEIPDSVTQLGTFCFSGCASLTSVTIPNQITSIPQRCFNVCSGLTNITIPNTVTSIGSNAFEGCAGLTAIQIPDSVTSIGIGAFYNCTGLTELTIPSGVTEIKAQLVQGCKFESFVIPNGVTDIERYVFYNCSNLKSLVIPPSVTSINGSMLYGGVPTDLKIYNLSSCTTDEITPKAAEYAITTVKDGKTEQQKVLPAAVAAGMEAYEGKVYDASYYYTGDGQGQWYVEKDSGYVPVTAEDDFKDSPTFYYAKKLTADSISITVSPEEQIYDGAEAEYEITVKDGETVLTKDTHYTCEITSTDGNGTSAGTNAGMVTITVTGVQSNGYIGSRDAVFEIKQSGSEIPAGGVKTYLGDVEQSTFHYGDTITVKVQAPKPTGVAARAFAAPTAGQMAVFKGNKQVSEAVDAVDGIYTMTVNTIDLLNGNLMLTVKYVGNENMADAVGTAAVVVEAPFQAVTISMENESPVYGESFTLTAQVDLEEWADAGLTYIWQYGSNIIEGETESTLTYDAGQLNAGTHKLYCTVDYLGFRLFNWKSITIKSANPDIGDVECSDTIYPTTALESITLTRTNETVPGTLALKEGQTLTLGTKSYSWVFTPSDMSNYNSLEGTVELTVVKDTLESISIKDTVPNKTSYTYGEIFDVGGLTVTATYASGNTADVTSCVTFGDLSAGQTSIELTYEEDDHQASCTVTGITVAKAEQTALKIEGQPDGPISFGLEFTLTTSGGSGDGAVTWSVSGPATVDGSGKVSVTGVGEIAVTATKAESANYNVTADTWTFISVKSDLSSATVTLSQNSYTYNGTPQYPKLADVTVVKNGVTIESKGNYTVSFSNGQGGIDRPTAADTYIVTINAIGLNYTGKNSTATFEIKQAVLTPTLTGDTTKVYDGTAAVPAGLTISLEGKVEDDDVAAAADIAYNSPNVNDAKAITATGITLNGADAGNYKLSVNELSIGGSITQAAAPAITWPTANDLTYGQELSKSTLSFSSNEYGTFAWADGNTVPTVVNNGYIVQFTPNADTMKNYESIANTTQTVSVTVKKATPAVSVNAEVSGEVGARQAVLTATIGKVGQGVLPTGEVTFVEVTDTETEIGTANVENGVAKFTWTGLAQQNYKVKAVYSGNTNYQTAFGEITFDASKKPQATFNIAAISSKTYGDSTFVLSATGGSGTGAVTFESSDSTVLSISGSTATIHKAGEVTITATKAADIEYNEATASVAVTVAKQPLTVTAKDETIIKGSKMPEFTYTVDGLVNSDTFTDADIKTAATDTNTTGEYSINISGGTLTNANSYDVTYKNGNLTITDKIVPNITLTAAPAALSGGGRVTLTADGVPTGGTVTVTCSDSSITVEGSGTAWAATLPNTTAEYTFTAAYSGDEEHESAEAACTVKVTQYSGGSASDNPVIVDRPDQEDPDSPTTVQTIPVRPDGQGNAAIPDRKVDDAISAALKDADKYGSTGNGIAVTVPVATTSVQNVLAVTLAEETLDTLVGEKVRQFAVTTEHLISFTLDAEALKSLDAMTDGDIILKVVRTSVSAEDFSQEAQTAIGTRPVYDITLWHVSGGIETPITTLNGEFISIAIPYTSGKEEAPDRLCIAYVDDQGGVSLLKDSYYDADQKAVLFEAEHFSIYGVALRPEAQEQEILVLPAQVRDLQKRTLNSAPTKIKYKKAPKTTVTYVSSNEKAVTVDEQGNIRYTGLGDAVITIRAAAENGYKEAVKELKVSVGLKRPTFTPFSRNDAFTLTTSTVKGALKFQVQYVLDGRSFQSAGAKTKTFTALKKLKQGRVDARNKKTYRIRVRAISGSVKSPWSPVKKITTK